MNDGRELIRVHELDKENFTRMNKLLNSSYFEDSAIRDELLAANVMRVLWVCHLHFSRNDTHGANFGSDNQRSAINDRNGRDEASKEMDSEPVDNGSTEPAALSVSDEMNEEPVLPVSGTSVVVDEDNVMSEDVGEELAKMDYK